MHFYFCYIKLYKHYIIYIQCYIKFIKAEGIINREYELIIDEICYCKGTLEHESSSEAELPVSSVDEAVKEKDIWRKGLKVLQQLGLDKTALAADKKCRPCQMYKTTR